MAEASQSVAGHLKLGAILVVAFMATILLIDVALLFSIQAEIGLVDKYGFGRVPKAEMAPFIKIGSISPAVLVGLGLLKTVCFIYFLYQSANALDRLGIAHRFHKALTGFSIVIPFVSFYLPWAALGETRQTFKSSLATGVTPARSVRRFDVPTFWLGLVWMVDAIAGAILSRTGDVGKIVDLASFRAVLGKATGDLVIGLVASSIVVVVFVVYARGLLRLYRAVLLRATADVFESPASPAPPPREAPVRLPGMSGQDRFGV